MSRRSGPAFSLPLAASIIGHGGIAVLLILFAGRITPPLPPEPRPAIELVLAPPPPVVQPPPEPPPPPPEPPPPPKPPPPPPEPPPQVVEPKPPPPALPRSKPAILRRPPPVRPPPPEPQPIPYQPPPVPYRPPQPLPPQIAPAPRPVAPPAAPVVSASYRAMLSAWLESHKDYPESARARGEEGRAVLRFHVARSGQVLNYAIVQGTGYPDLDAAIGQMMRGAALPPFPADMSAADIDVTVTIRYALSR